MAAAVVMMRSCNNGSGRAKVIGGLEKHIDTTGEYAWYTAEQVEVLERLYAECPKPSSMWPQQQIRDCLIPTHIDLEQIKVWFQNHRYRDKQRKESSQVQAVNQKLYAINKLFREKNEGLQRQVTRLVDETAYVKQQLQKTTLANDTSCGSVVTPLQNSLQDAISPAGVMSIAVETLAKFLSNATWTAVDWIQMLTSFDARDECR